MQGIAAFEDRRQAGRALAQALGRYAGQSPVIYALPRGGLPVAAEIARRLNAPLDLILVRKIGAPEQPELAIGAVVDGHAPTLILHDDIVRRLHVSENYITAARNEALSEIGRRRVIYLKDRPPISPKGKTAIIVDDGLATGATMEAAIKAARSAGAERLVIAVPVAPADTLKRLGRFADDIVCLKMPTPFWSVGGFYRSFPQITDDEVVACLRELDDGAQQQNRSA